MLLPGGTVYETGPSAVGASFFPYLLFNIPTTPCMQRPIVELIEHGGVLIHASPSTSVREGVALMTQHNVGALAVLSGGETLEGLFTERDLMTRVVHEGKDPATTPLREVMTTDVVVATKDMERQQALQLMEEHHFRHLPVSDGDHLVGMVSLRSLLRFERKVKAQEVQQMREYVQERPYPRYPG